MKNQNPILGITMGDPSGVGPEIIIKALSYKSIYEICNPIVIGDAKVIKKAIELFNNDLKINAADETKNSKFTLGTIDVYDLNNVDVDKLECGKVSSMSGKAAFEYIEAAIKLALDKKIDGTVTAPINKESIKKAGYKFAGHTEIYAHFTNTNDYTMMLAEGNLRVVHVSTHVSLRKACDLVKKEKILKTIELAHSACLGLGIKKPRVAVAGLNPHSGENGLFGDEEIEEIMPAINEAVSKGINAQGPVPADTVFSKAKGGMYDIVVAMYHDQGHIPLKVVGFDYDEELQKWKSVSGVNITLGLPILRTSVDHGTAFEIAWQGVANEDSLVNAIEYAVKLHSNN